MSSLIPSPVGGEHKLRSSETTVPYDVSSLSAYLRTQGFVVDPDQPVRQLAGGLANRNYLLALESYEAVLRCPPEGELPVGAHDMSREHRILSRLWKGLPIVPRGLHYCADAGVIGVPFQLIEYRPGIVVRGSDMSALNNKTDAANRLSQMLVSTLARIHAVDAGSIGLGDLGRPNGFIERAIAGWTKRGFLVTASAPAATVLIAEVGAWLAKRRFGARAAALLHCDFKLDNAILDSKSLQPVAVVDWDMGTRGDPLFDLATMLSYWSEPGDPECLVKLDQMPTTKPGFWRRHDAAQFYGDLTGIDLSDLPAMRVLALYKLGIVFLQLHQRWSAGPVVDGQYAWFDRLGQDILCLAKDVSSGLASQV